MARGQMPSWVRDLLGAAALLGSGALAVASARGRLGGDLPPVLGLFASALLFVVSLWILRAQRLLGRHDPLLRWEQFWGGSFAVGVGCFLALVSVADPRDEAFHAPRWVVMLAGAIFALFGAMAQRSAIYGDEAERKGDPVPVLLATLILTAFGVLCSFAAFGPGEREFEGGISIPFLSVDALSGEITGRIAFGLAAVLLDLLALCGWLAVLTALLGRRR